METEFWPKLYKRVLGTHIYIHARLISVFPYFREIAFPLFPVAYKPSSDKALGRKQNAIFSVSDRFHCFRFPFFGGNRIVLSGNRIVLSGNRIVLSGNRIFNFVSGYMLFVCHKSFQNSDYFLTSPIHLNFLKYH